MLVGASAALAVGLGEVIRLHTGQGDPTRMMHAVVTGIGFIGGGMIWTQKRARGPYRTHIRRHRRSRRHNWRHLGWAHRSLPLRSRCLPS